MNMAASEPMLVTLSKPATHRFFNSNGLACAKVHTDAIGPRCVQMRDVVVPIVELATKYVQIPVCGYRLRGTRRRRGRE
eukprot:6198818-Pleurochrysis_carterae.AAC.2